MKRIIIAGIATLLLLGLASAATEDGVLASLESYYQASVAEDLISFMSYMELDCEDHDCNAIAADISELWERITTTSVEIVEPEVVMGDSDAAVSYSMTASFMVYSDEGTYYEFTQDYELMAYMIQGEDLKWRVAYIMPTVFYEEAEVNMGALPLLVDMALEGEESAAELEIRGDMEISQIGVLQPKIEQPQDNTPTIAIIIVSVIIIILLLAVFLRVRKKPAPKAPAKKDVYCPKCGMANHYQSKFCQNCGWKLM